MEVKITDVARKLLADPATRSKIYGIKSGETLTIEHGGETYTLTTASIRDSERGRMGFWRFLFGKK
jgi:hypothetical protein